MPNYKNGKIYKIVSNQTNECYVGSTCIKYLSTRFAKHKFNYNNKIAEKSLKILKYNDCKIVLIENYSCNSKDELRMREEYYRKLLDTTNERKCILKTDEMRKYKNEKQKIYNKNNKEKLKNWRKQKIICECGTVITKGCYNKHKNRKQHNNFMDGKWIFNIQY